MKCINCKVDYQTNFCPECGENLTVQPISFVGMSSSAFGTLTNMDKGFLYNLKNLVVQPQKLINSYIQGKRKNVFNPISYLIVAISIYLLVSAFVKTPLLDSMGELEVVSALEQKEKPFFESGADLGHKIGVFIKQYFKYFWILSVFWLSITTKLFYSKHNFAEHLAINSFVIGQATLAGLLLLVLKRIPLFFDPIVYLTIFILLYKVHKSQGNRFEIIARSILSLGLFILLLIVSIIGIGFMIS